MFAVQPASRANCHVGFAQVAAKIPESQVASVVPVLIDILRDVPRMEFDQCLVWDGERFVESSHSKRY
jgi:phosphatidylinositol 4-kinase